MTASCDSSPPSSMTLLPLGAGAARTAQATSSRALSTTRSSPTPSPSSGRSFRTIEPRKQWPAGGTGELTGRIPPELQAAEGRALSFSGDAGWGSLVAEAKSRGERFDQKLVDAAAQLVRDAWHPDPPPTWVTAIPSLRTTLVRDFAERLAHALWLPYRESIVKVQEKPQQKEMENSAQQARNVIDAFEARPDEIGSGPVLLVDDIVDSKWSMTVCALRLRQAGSGPVYPLALAVAMKGRQ